MKVEKQSTMNKNGTYTTKKKIATTEEDGWVNVRETHGKMADPNDRYFKGKAVSCHFQTNDPKVTKPALFIFCIVVFIAAIAMIAFAVLLHAATMMFFGIVFMVFGVVAFVSNMRSIHRIEKEIQDKESNTGR